MGKKYIYKTDKNMRYKIFLRFSQKLDDTFDGTNTLVPYHEVLHQGIVEIYYMPIIFGEGYSSHYFQNPTSPFKKIYLIPCPNLIPYVPPH